MVFNALKARALSVRAEYFDDIAAVGFKRSICCLEDCMLCRAEHVRCEELLSGCEWEAELLGCVKVEAVSSGDFNSSKVNWLDELVAAFGIEDVSGRGGRSWDLSFADFD